MAMSLCHCYPWPKWPLHAAVPDAPSSFNLLSRVPTRRPFTGFVAAINIAMFPSGLVPGDGTDGYSVELNILIGEEGPDLIDEATLGH